MRWTLFLIATMFVFSCKKEEKGVEYDPTIRCDAEKESFNIIFERGECEGFETIENSQGEIDKDKFFAYVSTTEGENENKLVCNFRVEENQRIYINIAKENLNYIYTGSEMLIRLTDRVSESTYIIGVKATKKDEKCNQYVGYEKQK